MDFAAIDFETANEQSASACQLGVVVVRGGREISSHCWLIRPRPLRFSSHCVAIHGITPKQVAGEAEFGDLWSEIWNVLAGEVLVAHNAGFDIGVLRACLHQHRLAIPDMQFTCTRSIARQAWPNRPGYGLRAIADRLGIEFRHHDALEDARACAQVLLAAGQKWGESSLEKLEKRLCLTRGCAGPWGCGGPRRTDQKRGSSGWTRASYSRGAFQSNGYRNRNYRGDSDGRDGYREESYDRNESIVYQQLLSFHGDSPSVKKVSTRQMENWTERAKEFAGFSGQKVVLTGQLAKLQREDAVLLVSASGGKICSAVSRQTNVLVVGKPDERTLKAGRSISTKEEKVKELQLEGCNILVLDERSFMAKLLGREQTADLSGE